VCCGALHAHAGLRDEARRLARTNVAAFGDDDTPIVVNSAGCGAMLKEYGHLVDASGHGSVRRARADVSELLAERGPRPGAPLDCDRRVRSSLPLAARPADCRAAGADARCDSGATRGLSARRSTVLWQCRTVHAGGARDVARGARAKLASRQARPQVVATGNPGCLMQLGAGLAAAGIPAAVRHPVELLDESYKAAGYYA